MNRSTFRSLSSLGLPVAAVVFVALRTVSAVAAPIPADQVKDRLEAKPERLQGVDVEERLGGALPGDLDRKSTRLNSSH